MSFKMKRKPPEPRRKKYRLDKSFYSTTVQEIIDFCATLDVHPKDIVMETECEYYDTYNIKLSWTELESDEDFQKRLEVYHEKLREYVVWCDENKDEIAKYYAEKNRKSKITKKYIKEIEDIQKKMKKELEGDKND